MISSLMVGSVGRDENRSVELSRIIGQVSLLVLLKPLQSLNVESLPEQGKRKFPEFCLTELAWLLGAGILLPGHGAPHGLTFRWNRSIE
jgi:hypothetical protein